MCAIGLGSLGRAVLAQVGNPKYLGSSRLHDFRSQLASKVDKHATHSGRATLVGSGANPQGDYYTESIQD